MREPDDRLTWRSGLAVVERVLGIEPIGGVREVATQDRSAGGTARGAIRNDRDARRTAKHPDAAPDDVAARTGQHEQRQPGRDHHAHPDAEHRARNKADATAMTAVAKRA